jgi:hypothetical protein
MIHPLDTAAALLPFFLQRSVRSSTGGNSTSTDHEQYVAEHCARADGQFYGGFRAGNGAELVTPATTPTGNLAPRTGKNGT